MKVLFIYLLGSSRWPKSHEGSLLQPRLIDGNTGATPLLNRSGRSAWSGSESSLNSEADPPARVGDRAMSSTNSYRQSLSSCTLDPDSFTFASGKKIFMFVLKNASDESHNSFKFGFFTAGQKI